MSAVLLTLLLGAACALVRAWLRDRCAECGGRDGWHEEDCARWWR